MAEPASPFVRGVSNLYLNPAFGEAGELFACLRAEGLPLVPGDVRGGIRLEQVYTARRNLVARVSFRGRMFVVKVFRDPGALRGTVYRFWRDSKCSRAVANAFRLLDAGFSSPAPVAAWDELRAGRIARGWLVTEWFDAPLVAEFRGPQVPLWRRRALMRDLSLFLVRLHEAGFRPLDFNIGNVFYIPASPPGSPLPAQGSPSPDPDSPALPAVAEGFSLIDINRMQAGKVPSLKEAMLAFDQLGLLPEEIPWLLRPYADARGFDIEACFREVRRRRRAWRRRKRLIHPFRSF